MKYFLMRQLPAFFALAIVATASADEIVPATTATEDLKSFDQSIVQPEQGAPRAGVGAAISAEARRIRQEGYGLSKEADPTLRKNGKAAAGPTTESNPSNAPRNSENRTKPNKGKSWKQLDK